MTIVLLFYAFGTSKYQSWFSVLFKQNLVFQLLSWSINKCVSNWNLLWNILGRNELITRKLIQLLLVKEMFKQISLLNYWQLTKIYRNENQCLWRSFLFIIDSKNTSINKKIRSSASYFKWNIKFESILKTNENIIDLKTI